MDTTTVSLLKTLTETYRLRHGHDFATIHLNSSKSPPSEGFEQGRFCGEISIVSSYGNYAHTWGDCGHSFKEFLLDIEFDYFMGKAIKTNLHEYDGEETLKEVRKAILSGRKVTDLSHGSAATLWAGVSAAHDDIRGSVDGLVRALSALRGENPDNKDIMHFCAEPWERAARSYNSQAQAFWKMFWPTFEKTLRDEVDEDAITNETTSAPATDAPSI